MNSRLLKIVLTVFAALIGLAVVYAVLLNSSFFDIDEIMVSYSGMPSDLLLETERIISTYYGRNLVKTKSNEVEKSLLEQSVIEEVSVSKFFPTKLVIDIKYKDFILRARSADSATHYFLVGYDEITEVGMQAYNSYGVLNELELDGDFARSLADDGFDEGFEQVLTMLGQCTSKSLITGIKYLNNNRKTFGSLELQLKSCDATLTVKDPVTPQRLDEALAIIQRQVAMYGGADYILYASVLDRKK